MMEVSRSGFYAWLERPEGNRSSQNKELLNLIREAYKLSRGTYGSPRITIVLRKQGWVNLGDDLREQHRADLLQVLAYSTLFENKKVTSCLVYPCKKQTWESLRDRGRLHHRASLNAGKRNVNLVLTAIPMDAEISEVIDGLVRAVI